MNIHFNISLNKHLLQLHTLTKICSLKVKCVIYCDALKSSKVKKLITNKMRI